MKILCAAIHFDDVEESDSAFWWCYGTMFVLSVGWFWFSFIRFDDFVESKPKYRKFR